MDHRRNRLVTFVCLCVMGAAASAAALKREPVPLEVSAGRKQFTGQGMSISPDGQLAAFTVEDGRNKRPSPAGDSQVMSTGVPIGYAAQQVWIADLKSGALVKLAYNDSTSWSPVWSPDGQRLAFFSDRDGQVRLWVWERGGGRLSRASDGIVRTTNGGQERPQWLADSQRVLVKLLPEDVDIAEVLGPRGSSGVKGQSRRTGERDEVTVEVLSAKAPVAPAKRKELLGDLTIVNVESGELQRLVTRLPLYDYSVSPDGKLLAYNLSVDDRTSSGHRMSTHFIVASTENGEIRFTLKDQGWEGIPGCQWSADSRYLQCYIGTGAIQYLGYGVTREASSQAFLDTRTFTLKLAAEYPPSEMPVIAANDMQSDKNGYYWQIPGGSRLLYSRREPGRFPDLWIYDKHTRKFQRIVQIDPQYGQYEIGSQRTIEWTRADGRKFYGGLLLPPGYTPGRRYPLVVEGYPSSASNKLAYSYAGGWPWTDVQVLATRGYAVLSPDAPWEDATKMKDLAEEVLGAVDRVIDIGIADPERLAIAGVSHGGYLVRSVIVQTNRFKAAISMSGMGGHGFLDYATLFGDGSDGTAGANMYWGNPWKERDRFLNNAPYLMYDRITTPLLIYAGTNDAGFLPASDETFVALRYLGKDVEYVRYHGEGHTMMGFSNIVDFWNRRLDFLARHLNLKADARGAVAPAH